MRSPALRAHRAGEARGRGGATRWEGEELQTLRSRCGPGYANMPEISTTDGGSRSVTISARRRSFAVGVRAITGSYFQPCLEEQKKKKKVQLAELRL